MKTTSKQLQFLLISCSILLTNCDFDDKNYGSSISLDSPGLAVDASVTEAEFNLTANCAWTSSVDFSTGDKWCTLTPATGIGNTNIKVEMLPHIGAKRRTATITFRAQDELGQTISYSITQRGTAYYFDFDGTVTENLFEVGESAGSVSFTFFAGTSWKVEKTGTDNDWLTLKAPSGEKGDITFEMAVSQNTGARPRSVDLLFTSTENPSNTALITVRQLRILPAASVTVTNNDQFSVNWTAVANASSYDVVIKNANDKSVLNTISSLSAATLSTSLSDIDFGTYLGPITVEVKCYFDNDPELYSYSAIVTTHSRFDNTSGNGTPGSEYVISCARHLTNISMAKSASYKQIANIDCSKLTTFVPIGDTNSPFNGSYTAQNGTNKFKISKLTVAYTSNRTSGLFGSVGVTGKISHLILENSSLSLSNLSSYNNRDTGHGLLVGINSGVISNIDIVNCTITGHTAPENKYIIGGIVGTNYKGQVTNCTATGGKMTISGRSTAGAIVGYSGRRGIEFSTWSFPNDISAVTNCTNYSMEVDGDAQPTTDGSTGVGAIGGVVGGNEFIISNCSNNAYVHGSYYSGGILGTNSYDKTIGYSGSQVELSKCFNSGRVEGRWAGGIVAAFVQNSAANQSTTVISECINTGSISSNFTGSGAGNTENHVGGIAARNYGVIRNCYNTGTINGNNNSNTGGICGDLYKVNGGVYNSYNSGKILNGFPDATGAIAGYLAAGATITNGVYLNGTFTSPIGNGQISKLSATSTTFEADESQMKSPSTFSGWDTAIWNIVSGKYPSLKNRKEGLN